MKQKEKEEILFIVGAVLLVAVIGLVVLFLAEEKTAAVGEAISSDVPTPTGVLVLMNEYCEIKEGGVCNEICGSKTCFPVEANCDEISSQCLCCESP